MYTLTPSLLIGEKVKYAESKRNLVLDLASNAGIASLVMLSDWTVEKKGRF